MPLGAISRRWRGYLIGTCKPGSDRPNHSYVEQLDFMAIARSVLRRSTIDVPRSFVLIAVATTVPSVDVRHLPTSPIPRFDVALYER